MEPRRAFIWSAIVFTLSLYYWSRLVESLDGNILYAVLVVMIAWICGCVDMNELTGQPEAEHSHDD
jgi:hypothetical protein